MLRGAAFLILNILPGAWITFGLPLRQFAFSCRLLTGVLLSPLVVGLEFYAVRLLGASFEQTSIVLVFLNLPALYLIWRHGKRITVPERRTWLAWSLVILISAICLLPVFLQPGTRMYVGHNWVYSEPVYAFAKGELLPEDPDLAGTKMMYPIWGGLIHQAILSYLLDSPPMFNYIWTNLVYLVVVFGFSIGLIEEFGGGWLAKLSSGVWLFLGANSAGYALEVLLPKQLTEAVRIWGDGRYTPWVLKFMDFNTMPVILGIFVALAYLLIRHSPERFTKDFLFVLFLLVSCVGIFYPILYPPVCAILGAKAIAVLLERREVHGENRYRPIAALATVLLLSAAVVFAHYLFLTQGRATSKMVLISEVLALSRKTVEFLVVTSPLLAGLAIAFPKYWKERRAACIVLGLAALASFVLTVMFNLPFWDNEYKFVFTAAICMAPFSGLAMEHLVRKWGPVRGFPIVALALLLLFGVAVHRMLFLDWTGGRTHPLTDVRNFYIRLDPSDRFSGIFEALRLKTPLNTIVTIQKVKWHPPTFTNRSLYMQYERMSFPGVNQGRDTLLARVRGNGEKIVKERQQTLVDLYESPDDARRAQSVSRLLELRRPIAIVLDTRHAALLEWLKASTRGTAVYEGNGMTLWLIQPSPDM